MDAIPGITLYDVAGTPVESGGLLIVPAFFDFCGPTVKADRLAFAPPPSLEEWLRDDGFDPATLFCAWARARLTLAFGFRPTCGDVDRQKLLDCPFLAVRLEPHISLERTIPFVCMDGGKGPTLVFRRDEEGGDVQSSVAAAFWNTLLRAPQELASFDESFYDPHGYWYKLVFERGHLWVYDVWDDDGSDDEYEHPSIVPEYPGERFRCPDCDGSGIDDHEFYTDDCPTCRGTGQVTW